MKTFFYLLLLSTFLFANNNTTACIKCHPTIVAEFQTSMHKKSSIYEDKIHSAVWNLHPAKKKNNYKCAKCHTPNAKTEADSHKGITCISCHTIIDVKEHTKSNQNIYEKKPKKFYSAEKGRENEKVTYKTVTTWWGDTTTVGSAYHDIDYTHKQFYNGKMCMGCHSHKQNSKNFTVCATGSAQISHTKETCITCHMPKVLGSATTVRKSKMHAFHGFTGARVKPKMLSKYVTLSFKQMKNIFTITLHNQAPHNLLTHPLRVLQLKVNIIRNNKYIALKTHTFQKIIGHNGKPSMPWLATEVIKDNMIQADETRVIQYDRPLLHNDRIEVTLGYYLVNPKALKKLNLENEKNLKKFIILKQKYFTMK